MQRGEGRVKKRKSGEKRRGKAPQTRLKSPEKNAGKGLEKERHLREGGEKESHCGKLQEVSRSISRFGGTQERKKTKKPAGKKKRAVQGEKEKSQ